MNLVVRTFHTSQEVELVPTYSHFAYSRFAYSRFAYSCFAYFRPKSGVSATLKRIIFGHQSDVGVDFHHAMPESRADAHLGAKWTSTTLDKDFFMAEDGQEEDRLIMFAMSSLILYYCCSKQYKELLERSFFLKSRRNATFWSKVGKTGV